MSPRQEGFGIISQIKGPGDLTKGYKYKLNSTRVLQQFYNSLYKKNMCGFCSYFHFDTSSQHQELPNLDLDTALQYIHHRGPDSRGKFISPDGRCGT